MFGTLLQIVTYGVQAIVDRAPLPTEDELAASLAEQAARFEAWLFEGATP